jgi:hypothetical protein
MRASSSPKPDCRACSDAKSISSESLCYNRFASQDAKRYTGGCLGGALCYEAVGEPIGPGLLSRRLPPGASGSGFIPLKGDAVRNRCANSVSLVFGGEIGASAYALVAHLRER